MSQMFPRKRIKTTTNGRFSKLFKIYASSHVTLFILHKKLSEKQFTIIKK